MKHKATILVLGQDGVGKKTLLEQAQQHLNSEANGVLMLWSNKETQFIVPQKPLDQETCQALFQFAKKNNSLQPLQSILLVVDIPTLIDRTASLQLVKIFSEQLHLVHAQQQKIDINLIITKCDRLLGFKEYFTNLNVQERQKMLRAQGTQDFTPLLKKLNAHIISRLHQETLAQRRRVIQLFPAEMEKATECIETFSKTLLLESHAAIGTIYFTSSKQKDKSIDLLNHHDISLPPVISDKPYFIAEAFAQLIQEAHVHQLTAKQLDKKRWIILPICLILVATLITTWHLSYKNTSAALKKIELQLQHPTTTFTATWLNHLQLLSTALQDLDNPDLKYSHMIGFSQTHTLQKKLLLLYHAQLHTQFLPFIEGILSSTMLQNSQTDPLQVYNALKIYLMLTEQSHYDKNTILNWFSSYFQSRYATHPEQAQFMLQQLENLLLLQNKNWPRNQPLIDQTRAILQKLPAANIIFLELQGNYKNQTQSVAELLESSDHLDLSQAIIQSLYSPNNFRNIYNIKIPSLVSTFKQGNWVMGETDAAVDTISQQENLIASVRALYLQNLSQNWQKVISKIKLKNPTNLSDIQNLINEVTDPHSSLMELLEFVCVNADSDKQKPNAILQNITQFLQQKGPYIQSKTALQNLATYIAAIVKNDDVDKASYNSMISILNNPNQHNPINAVLKLNLNPPIQNWLNTIAQGSTALLLTNSRNYLNKAWSRIVLPTYLSGLDNRYPLNSDSHAMISLTDFTNFLGPDGTIDVFFNYYLKPFVNMSNTYWVWQSIYGQAMPMPQSVLDMFMRASIIQQMFFTDNHQKMSFKFSLIPVAQSDHIKNITLNIEGQIQQSTSAMHSGSLISWPGPQPERVVLHVTFNNGTPPLTQTFTGPWALFQFIQSATLIPQNQPQRFVLQFKFGDDSATYHIITNHRVNPFIPSVLNQLSCPDLL